MPEPTTFTDALLEEWEVFGRAAGWSEETVRTRRLALALLATAAGVPLEQVGALPLARWLTSYASSGTRATYWRHAHSFYSWLKVSGYRIDDPTEQVKAPPCPRGVPRPVNTEVLTAMLEADLKPDMRAWIILGAYAGLRVHELAKIRGEDIDLGANTLRVLGKGGKEAVLPMHPRVRALAEVYPRLGWWFPRNTQSGYVGSKNITNMMNRRFAAEGHHVTPHMLRHWFGTNVLNTSGGNLRVAQELLRHSSPATTAIYTRIDDSQRSAAVMALA